MKLNQTEAKLVAQLRKTDKAWRWGKPLLVIVAPLGIVAWFIMYFRVNNLLTENPDLHAIMMPYFFPLFLFNCGVCGVMLGILIRDWRGNAVRHLLLKLIDQQMDKDS